MIQPESQGLPRTTSCRCAAKVSCRRRRPPRSRSQHGDEANARRTAAGHDWHFLAGFAGAAADAFHAVRNCLIKLRAGQLTRAAVELAKVGAPNAALASSRRCSPSADRETFADRLRHRHLIDPEDGCSRSLRRPFALRPRACSHIPLSTRRPSPSRAALAAMCASPTEHGAEEL